MHGLASVTIRMLKNFSSILPSGDKRSIGRQLLGSVYVALPGFFSMMEMAYRNWSGWYEVLTQARNSRLT